MNRSSFGCIAQYELHCSYFVLHTCGGLVAQQSGHWIRDCKVYGSVPK